MSRYNRVLPAQVRREDRNIVPLPAPDSTELLDRGEGGPELDDPTERLHSLWRYRQQQIDLFPECVLNYPSWDILLLCFRAQTKGEPLCVKEIECQLQQTHGALLRRISTLENAGLIERCRDESDWRRTRILLTADAVNRMVRYLEMIR